MTKGLEIRKLLALTVLLCGAASADAAEPWSWKWCSKDGHVFEAIGIAGEVDYWVKVDGKIVQRGTPEDDPATLITHGCESEECAGDNSLVYQHRVFWPCD